MPRRVLLRSRHAYGLWTKENAVELEEHNAREIEGLNQRGGRTLSIVDLIQANTVNVEMAAYFFSMAALGASFLTAARPGGAGKTTLLGCLLNFLSPGTRIVTASDPGVLRRVQKLENDASVCLLAHEIGSGPWFAYIWGEHVREFFEAISHSCSVASCIHADTIDELQSILTSPELSVPLETFRSVDLICFMHVEFGAAGYRRRVCRVYESAGPNDPHRLLFEWDRETDLFRTTGEPRLSKYICAARGLSKSEAEAKLWAGKELLERLVAEDVRFFRDVRREVASFLVDFHVQ